MNHFTIGYFFTIQHPSHAELFSNYLCRALRTQDPTAPEETQPSLVEGMPNTVGFVENVNSKQLQDIYPHVKALIAAAFATFWTFCDQIGGAGQLGVTIHFVDEQGRKAALFVQSQEGSRETLAFGYQVGFTENELMTPDTVTHLSDGKSCMDAVLAYYGELSNVSGQSTH